MQAYIFTISVLFCIVFAAEGTCLTGMVIKRLKDFKKLITCTCNKTSTEYKNSCNCFEIPQKDVSNLTCYQDAVAKYKQDERLQENTRQAQQALNFVEITFPNLVNSCNISRQQPCGQMVKVNASFFWHRLETIFQRLATRKI